MTTIINEYNSKMLEAIDLIKMQNKLIKRGYFRKKKDQKNKEELEIIILNFLSEIGKGKCVSCKSYNIQNIQNENGFCITNKCDTNHYKSCKEYKYIG